MQLLLTIIIAVIFIENGGTANPYELMMKRETPQGE
jgi:hypothetical protein